MRCVHFLLLNVVVAIPSNILKERDGLQPDSQRVGDQVAHVEKRQATTPFIQYDPFPFVSGKPPNIEPAPQLVRSDGQTITFTQYNPFPFTPFPSPSPVSQTVSPVTGPRTSTIPSPSIVPPSSPVAQLSSSSSSRALSSSTGLPNYAPSYSLNFPSSQSTPRVLSTSSPVAISSSVLPSSRVSSSTSVSLQSLTAVASDSGTFSITGIPLSTVSTFLPSTTQTSDRVTLPNNTPTISVDGSSTVVVTGISSSPSSITSTSLPFFGGGFSSVVPVVASTTSTLRLLSSSSSLITLATNLTPSVSISSTNSSFTVTRAPTSSLSVVSPSVSSSNSSLATMITTGGFNSTASISGFITIPLISSSVTTSASVNVTSTTLASVTSGFVMNTGGFNVTTSTSLFPVMSTRTFVPTSGFITNAVGNSTTSPSILLPSSSITLTTSSTSSSLGTASTILPVPSTSSPTQIPTTSVRPPTSSSVVPQPQVTSNLSYRPSSTITTLSDSNASGTLISDTTGTILDQTAPQGATSSGRSTDTKLVVALSVSFIGVAIILGLGTFFFLRSRRRRKRLNENTFNVNSVEKRTGGQGEGSALLGGLNGGTDDTPRRSGSVRSMRDLTGRNSGPGSVMRAMSGLFLGGNRRAEGERARRGQRRISMLDGEETPRSLYDDGEEEDFERRQTEKRGVFDGANGSTRQLLDYGATAAQPRHNDGDDEEGRSSNETVRADDAYGGMTRGRPRGDSTESLNQRPPISRNLEVKGAPQLPTGNYAITTYHDPFSDVPESPLDPPVLPQSGSSGLQHSLTTKSLPAREGPWTAMQSPSTASLYGSNFRQGSVDIQMSPEEAQRLGIASFLPPLRNPFRKDSMPRQDTIRDPRPPPTMTVLPPPDDNERAPADVPLPPSSDGHGSTSNPPENENRGLFSGLINVFRPPSMTSSEIDSEESTVRPSMDSSRESSNRLSLPRLQPPTQGRFDPWETDYGPSQDASPIDPHGRFDIPGFKPPEQSTSYPKTPLDPRQNPFRRGSVDSFYDSSEAGSLPPGGGSTLFVANPSPKR